MMYLGVMGEAGDRPTSPAIAESLIVATLLAAFTLAFALRWGA
jgi:hypothetical protein